MAQIYGPNIVKSGLSLLLDAADKKSYPGSGTTWYDTVNANNVTLNNSPTYSTDGIQSFVFNGTNTYCSLASPSLPQNTKTVLCWCKPDSTAPSNTYTGLISWGGRDCGTSTVSNSLLLSINTGGSTWYLSSAYWCNDYVPDTLVVNKNAWNFVGIIARAIVTSNNTTLIVGNSNGLNFNTGNSGAGATKTILTNNTNLAVGCTDYPGRFYKGNIASVSVYNGELSTDDIYKIFIASKTRFGL